MQKIIENLKSFNDHCDEEHMRNKPNAAKFDDKKDGCCESCWIIVKKFIMKVNRNHKWHKEAQVILSCTIVEIVKYLSLKLELVKKERQNEEQEGD